MEIRIGLGNNEKIATAREFKGTSLLEALDDYIVLDLETTGLDPTYDNIIEIAAVRIEDGNVVEQFESLINPGYAISGFITDLTGITNDMLADAPNIADVLPWFLSFVGEHIIIAHNANFDVNFLYEACRRLPSPANFSNDFIDTMRLSRRLFPQHRHHRLGDLTERFGIEGVIEHRALSDVVKTNQCYVHMKNHAVENDIPFESLYSSKGSSYKASDISATVSSFDETTPIFGRVFVFTGTLEKMVRKDAMQLVVNMGGLCSDNVTKETNYLVLGNHDYCTSIKDGKSSKQKKAEKQKTAGMDIEIISENVFYDMIAECSDDFVIKANPSSNQEVACPVDVFEKQCLLLVQGILHDKEVRYGRASNGIELYTSFWKFLTIGKMKKGYFVQMNCDFDLTPYESALTCDSTKSCKRIFINSPEDLNKLKSYIIDKSNEMDKSWKDYTKSVSSASAGKRLREYTKNTYTIVK